jgi:S1-C subfamily serine protease
MVKQFLSQRKVSFEEKDVSRNQAYAQELIRTTGQMGVPVTVFDGEVVVGFDRPRLEQLLTRMQANQRPSIGASIADASKITARQGSRITFGAYVGRTKPGSIAQRIGLAPGDIITQLNMRNIANADDLERELSNLQKGSRLSIVFLRGAKTMTAEAIL